MKIPLFQIDAFTSRIFGGNPAAVCPLESWLPDETMQAIATENNLSETAFFVETTFLDKRGDHYDLRWFTPTAEVDLCGHATLATAHLLINVLGMADGAVHFETRSGRLSVRPDGERLEMDFPAQPPELWPSNEALDEAMGATPEEVLGHIKCIAVYGDEAQVRALAPDMGKLVGLSYEGVIATAPGDEVDFVSRYFAPKVGIPEDPVTGSAHCELTPYWAKRLGREQLSARQISLRGGALTCRLQGNRVLLSGRAVKYLEGVIEL